MGKTKKTWLEFLFGYSKLQHYGSDTEHRSPTAATMTGWDTSCDSEPYYFDSMQRTGRVSCTCHVMLPTNRCTQSCRFCCCRAQGFLSHMCTTRITYRLPYRFVTDLLLRWSQSGAHPVASTAPRHTRALLWWLLISNEKQISTQVDYLRPTDRPLPP